MPEQQEITGKCFQRPGQHRPVSRGICGEIDRQPVLGDCQQASGPDSRQSRDWNGLFRYLKVLRYKLTQRFKVSLDFDQSAFVFLVGERQFELIFFFFLYFS